MNGRRIRVTAVLSLISALVLTDPALAADPETYVLLSERGGKAGDLVVRDTGGVLEIDWQSKDNGRGTETHERLERDAEGWPVDWRIDTRSDFGSIGSAGPSAKTVTLKRDGETIRIGGSDAPKTLAAPGPTLFTPKEASPWALGLYARLLLKSPDHKLPATPDGRAELKRIGEETVAGYRLVAYEISLPGRKSETIRLDADGRLVAVGDGDLVLADRLPVAAALRAATARREEEAHAALQAKLLHDFKGPVRVRNIRIFDPAAGNLGAPASVLFENGVIKAIGAANASGKDETIIEGEGGTLVPGLHDTHFHLGLSYPEGVWLSLAGGVTTARDMGSDNDYVAHYLPQIASGRLPGPRLLLSGMIEGDSPVSLKGSGIVAKSEAEALAAVRWYAAHGYWQIKIYNSLDASWVPAIAHEAHRLGLRVAGHIPAFTDADHMIESGYDEITHANQLMLGWVLKPGEDTRTPLRLTAMSRFFGLDIGSPAVRRTLDQMESRKIAFEPTLAIMRRLLTNRTGEVEPEDGWWFSHFPKEFKAGRMISVLPGFTIMPVKTPADDAAYDGAAEKMIELTREMNRRGIMILPGADDNNGFIIRRELDLFVRAGMTPAQALARATIESARYLGHEKNWGTIEAGKSADFFLVTGDPSRSLDALHGIRMTVAQGRVYFPSEIYEAFDIKPFATVPLVRERGGRPPLTTNRR